MGITKTTVDEVEMTLMEFGSGDINMRFTVGEGHPPGAVFKTTEPRPIGLGPDEPEATLDEWNPEVMMTFSCVESLDVVINHLIELRHSFPLVGQDELVDDRAEVAVGGKRFYFSHSEWLKNKLFHSHED